MRVRFPHAAPPIINNNNWVVDMANKYHDISQHITFDPPERHHLAGQKVKLLISDNCWTDAKLIHVFGDNQFFLVAVKDYNCYTNTRFECVRKNRIKYN